MGRGKAAPPSTDAAGLDVRWPAYVAAAKAAGLSVGGYWRFYPDRPRDPQVDAFARRLLADDALDLPPMCDLEDTAAVSPVNLTDWAISVLVAVQQATGRRPVLYTYRWFLANALDPARLAQWPLSLAATTGVVGDWPDLRATWWQYAQNVTVPWATGPVDLQRRRTA